MQEFQSIEEFQYIKNLSDSLQNGLTKTERYIILNTMNIILIKHLYPI